MGVPFLSFILFYFFLPSGQVKCVRCELNWRALQISRSREIVCRMYFCCFVSNPLFHLKHFFFNFFQNGLKCHCFIAFGSAKGTKASKAALIPLLLSHSLIRSGEAQKIISRPDLEELVREGKLSRWEMWVCLTLKKMFLSRAAGFHANSAVSSPVFLCPRLGGRR